MIRRGLVAVTAVLLLASCSDDKGDVNLAADESTTSTSEETTTTTSTTAAPTTTTTAAPAPAPTTTAKPKPTTTTTTIPASMARVTIVNNYPASMVVSINAVKVTVGANSRKGPYGVVPGATDGNDIISLRRSDDSTCGTADAGGYFTAGGTYEVTVFQEAPSGCDGGKPSPGGRVNPGDKHV